MAPRFRPMGLDHVVIRATYPERMCAFNSNVLACPLEQEEANIGLVQLGAGWSLINLADSAGEFRRMGDAAPKTKGRNMDHLCLRIDPFGEGAIRTHLESCGIAAGLL